jgi:LysM repeat protein
MTLRMLDSVTPANLPPGADAYLGYVDGRFANLAEIKTRFPHAHILSLAVFAQHDADGCDIENGDLDVTQVPAWVKRQLARGAWRPVVYASASVMPGVLAHLHTAGIPRNQVRTWSAHYGEGKHICGPKSCAFLGVPDCDGTQWTDAAKGTGGSEIDESVLLPGFFTKPPPPPPHVGPYRHLTKAGDTLDKIAARRGTTTAHLLEVSAKAYTPADLLMLAGVKLPADVPYYTTNK